MSGINSEPSGEILELIDEGNFVSAVSKFGDEPVGEIVSDAVDQGGDRLSRLYTGLGKAFELERRGGIDGE